MSRENCGCSLSDTEESAVSVLLEKGLSDDIVAKALEAAKKVIGTIGDRP